MQTSQHKLPLNGARGVESIEGAMHVITNTSQFEGWRRVEDGEVDVVVGLVLEALIIYCL